MTLAKVPGILRKRRRGGESAFQRRSKVALRASGVLLRASLEKIGNCLLLRPEAVLVLT